MLWREGPGPAASVDQRVVLAVAQSAVATAQQKPASSRAAATAMIVRRLWRCSIRCPDVVQAPLRLPGQRDDLGLAVALAAREAAGDARCAAVVPGGLDQQPAGVLAAGLGDRAAPAALAGGVLGGDDAEIAHHLRGVAEAVKVADLRAQPGRGQRVDPAQAHQPPGGLRPRRARATRARSRPRAARGGSSTRRPRRDSPPTPAGTPAARADTPASHPRCAWVQLACGPSKRTSWRSSSLARRWRARIRSPRRSSRARTRSRSASSSTLGTATAMQLPRRQQPDQPLGVTTIGLDPISRSARDQPRRAHHAIDAGRAASLRASTNPVGPAS